MGDFNTIVDPLVDRTSTQQSTGRKGQDLEIPLLEYLQDNLIDTFITRTEEGGDRYIRCDNTLKSRLNYI